MSSNRSSHWLNPKKWTLKPWPFRVRQRNSEREMLVVLFCGERVKEIGTEKAPGSCPYCGSTVVVTDVETERNLFCLPIYVKSKRNFSCKSCLKRLVPII
ncbi:hypothetical protein LUZ60_008983 [Juncus effusus]|nr:hypothetical protein LUZ60_008983 [Juncus effusus]